MTSVGRRRIPGIWGDDVHYGREQQPERSLWLQQALEGEHDLPPLSGAVRADVCIVGGGYTGLWTAIRIKELEPSTDVVVLEADICGGGPSGRNGGFMDPWWVKFFALRQLCGTDEALRLCRMSSAAIDGIEAFCHANGIDAHIRRDGGLWTAGNEAGMGSWRPTVAELERFGVSSFREVERDELARLTGTDVYLGGVFDDEQATVHPARLARGLRRVALERGVRIHEHSPITRLDRGDAAAATGSAAANPGVRTARGSVTADRVVLAIGAWMGQIHELRNAFAVIATDMVATEPIPELLDQIGLTSGIGISDSRMLINYYRTTLDGRIAWGKGGGSLAYGGRIGRKLHGPSPRPQDVAESLRWHYAAFADVRITHSWTGPVDRSLMGVPFFSRLPGSPRILYGAGYSGNGVAPSFLGGRILASLALDRDDEHASAGVVRDPLGQFPPEPARWLGGMVVRNAVARAERAEDLGRTPGKLTKLMTRLAPPGPSEPR